MDSRILLLMVASTCLLLLSTLIILIVLWIRKRDEMRSGSKTSDDSVKSGDDTVIHSNSEMLMVSSLESDMKSNSQLAITMNQHQLHPFSSSHNQILAISPTSYSHLEGYSDEMERSSTGKWFILNKSVNPDVIPHGK